MISYVDPQSVYSSKNVLPSVKKYLSKVCFQPEQKFGASSQSGNNERNRTLRNKIIQLSEEVVNRSIEMQQWVQSNFRKTIFVRHSEANKTWEIYSAIVFEPVKTVRQFGFRKYLIQTRAFFALENSRDLCQV